ncbi:DUF4912 domain-containing protein [Nodosilinea sp. FACHB-141]|uniref:DUF4912 domain-containing protein n=1 Tax=Leptolyngbya subtilissima TaxID=1346803 RepID=UPI0016837C30|nr:DUF4912 domain-containing protein [Nodosilinea sp. FACHB-141]MBD2110906.1 DUF4912 domain-containing protein [Nodosilinea sp. FACHB-141]
MQYSVKLLVAALFALSPAAHLELRNFALAQVAQSPAFSLPGTVPSGTTLSIQSSPNLGFAADALKQEFEAAYDGSEVGVEVTNSDGAIAALIDGDTDLAAIGRPLTEEEQAQDLNTVALDRAKIAIIIGADNPFDGNLTFEQFAGMFRGDITDWAEVGGEPGPIRFVDRPEDSDTRRSLSQYDVFSGASFEAGPTTDTVAEDDTAAVIQALNDDGISYAIAPHVTDQPAVKIVPMHQTLPDDPRYPYSQPRYFVYKGEPSPAVAAFLGYATSSTGQSALAAAQVAEVGEVAAGVTAPGSPAAEETPAAAPAAGETDTAAEAPAEAAPVADNNAGFPWWWLLLPLAALGGLAWAIGRSRRGLTPGPGIPVDAPPTAEHPLPTPIDPAVAASPVDPVVVPPVVVDEPVAAAMPEGPAPVVDLPEPAPIVPPVPEPEIVVVDEVPAAPEPAVIPPEPEPAMPAAVPVTLGLAALAAGAAASEAPAPVVDLPEPAPVEPPVPEPEIVVVDEVPAAPGPAVAPPEPEPVVPAAVPVTLGLAGLAAGAAASLASTEDQSAVEASKYNVIGRPAEGDIDLSTIDDGLPPLPDGYGESRIVLMPRDPQWAYAYWDTPNSRKEELRRQGGEHLALRLYDVTGINLDSQAPHSLQQVGCDELAREWYMQIPVSDRDYQVEIGYLTGDGHWLVLARSNTIRVPPVYPSDWTEEHFLTVIWDENLRGKTIMTLVDPRVERADAGALHAQLYSLAQGGEALRVDGSLFGSMQHVAGSMAPPISSYIFPSGAGLGAAAMGPGPTMSGMSGFTLSGFPGQMAEFPGLTMSGIGSLTMSGIAGLTMSGVGFSASAPPIRPRKFWLVADAELIVYGATEPDATVTVAGNPIQLSEEGTFRFQISFQDGTVEYPIMAVAADSEQSRNIHMTFERQTPERRTNTKDEAQEEWPNL